MVRTVADPRERLPKYKSTVTLLESTTLVLSRYQATRRPYRLSQVFFWKDRGGKLKKWAPLGLQSFAEPTPTTMRRQPDGLVITRGPGDFTHGYRYPAACIRIKPPGAPRRTSLRGHWTAYCGGTARRHFSRRRLIFSFPPQISHLEASTLLLTGRTTHRDQQQCHCCCPPGNRKML